MEYLVAHRRDRGSAAYRSGPMQVYHIIADNADAAKKTACRLDGQSEAFYAFYNAIPAKKKRPALAGAKRSAATKGSSVAGGLETNNIISQSRESIKRGRWL